MHFAHIIPHILHVGGVPAGIGLVLGGFLGWPREDAAQSDGDSPFLAVPTYHNLVGGSGMTLEGAFGVMVGLAIFLALLGLLAGYLLIELGLVKKEDLGTGD